MADLGTPRPRRGTADGSVATRFKPGNPGRPPGARNKRKQIIEQMIDGDLEEMTGKIVLQARHGNQAAIFYCLNRVAPASKEPQIELDLPPLHSVADVAEASRRLIAALAEGDVTPGEAGRVMALLMNHLSILDAGEPEEAEPEG
jgi:hypothetical protein